MNELLSHPYVQTALVLVIVTGLNALVAWLKQKFPTQVALVESNWCYLQPLVLAAIVQAKAAGSRANLDGGVGGKILLATLAQFEETYLKLEGKRPTSAELNAARNEITAAINRAVGG